MAERKRATIPITGIDTSTPNHSVEDGKCETLHNLRYTGGAWRNVQEFVGKPIPHIDGYDILYKHPATPETDYIAIAKEESSNDTPTLYGYLGDDKLFYTPLPLADNYVIGKPFYDNNLFQLGYIVDCEEYADDDAGATILTTPKLDTLRVYGFSTTERDQAAPRIDRLYFPEGKPTIGSIAMQYGANGMSEFSYYGTIKDYDGSSVYLANIHEQGVYPEDVFAYELLSETSIFVADTHSTMYQIKHSGKVMYLNSSDFDSIVDTLAYIEEDGEFKLCFMIDSNSDSSNTTLRYYVMERYLDGIQTLTIPSWLETTEVHWFEIYDLNRFRSADKINEASYRPLYAISIDGDGFEVKQEICKVSENAEVSHFGNMLVVRQPQKRDIQYFLLDNNKYRPYANNLSLSFSLTESANIAPESVKWVTDKDVFIIGDYAVKTWETISEAKVTNAPLATTQNDYFRGEFAIFAALRSANGAILYRTPVQIYNGIDFKGGSLSVVNGNTISFDDAGTVRDKIGVSGISIITEEVYNTLNSGGVSGLPLSIDELGRGFAPYSSKYKKVTVEFSGAITHDDVYDVAFYTTRLYPLTIGMNINDVDVMQEPFYLLHTIRKSEIVADNTTSFVIDGSMIDNAENYPLYEATQSTALYSDNTLEYNNRIHMLGTGYAPSTILPNTLLTTNKYSSVDAYRTTAITQGQYDNTIFQNEIAAATFANEDNLSLSYAKTQPYIWTFAGKIDDIYFANADLEYSNKFTLKYSPALDMSYLINRSTTRRDQKYEKVTLSDRKVGSLDRVSEGNIFSANRLQVSELNDPYTYPYNNSYRIGSATNRIITANSAAIEMSDAKFGEFPLYVFTTEGIYAMQSGTESLYSAVIPINYDVVINPNTLAVNGAVLYFTDKGLHALTNQGAQLLSAPLHTSENRIPEWMRTTQMVYLPEWNEVLCADLPNRKAYVFSLDSKAWSTRDIPEGYILNNDELVGDNFIYNLRNEKEQGKDSISVGISTRPIKLGSMELKRAETIIVRFECATEQTLNVKVEGSVDTQHWQTLRELEDVKTNKDIIIRRTPCSVKYLRFIIRGEVTDDIRILAFEVEYYHRWMRKMR